MISVIVVNWNSGLQLRRCVESLLGEDVSEICVVDNASCDGSASLVLDLIGVEVIFLSENIGFGAACNVGARRVSGEFLLFINPDAAICPGGIRRVLDFVGAPGNSSVGICGVQLFDESGQVSRTCARFPSPLGFVFQSCGVDRLIPRLGHAMAEWPHDATRDVDQVIGAFFLVRRTVFEQLDGFDERFFVYFEEVDFSLRARRGGWRSVYFSEVRAFHAGGGTSRQVKAKRLFYSLRSRLLYAAKHFNILGVTAVSFFTLLVEPISRSVLAIARGSWAGLKETWQGYAMLWAWLPEWFARGVRG